MCVSSARGALPSSCQPGAPELLCDIFASITRSNVRASSRRSRGRAATSRASRANHLILPASPTSDLGPHISTPLCKNVAVHHSKNCALMSQMGQIPSVVMSAARPLFHQKQKSTRDLVMSYKCQEETYAV